MSFPRIDFTFSGFVQGAEIKEVYETATGKKINCQNMDVDKLLKNLRSGDWSIPFADVYSETRKTNCEITDFDEA